MARLPYGYCSKNVGGYSGRHPRSVVAYSAEVAHRAAVYRYGSLCEATRSVVARANERTISLFLQCVVIASYMHNLSQHATSSRLSCEWAFRLIGRRDCMAE